jgi:hypothetical protein
MEERCETRMENQICRRQSLSTKHKAMKEDILFKPLLGLLSRHTPDEIGDAVGLVSAFT